MLAVSRLRLREHGLSVGVGSQQTVWPHGGVKERRVLCLSLLSLMLVCTYVRFCTLCAKAHAKCNCSWPKLSKPRICTRPVRAIFGRCETAAACGAFTCTAYITFVHHCILSLAASTNTNLGYISLARHEHWDTGIRGPYSGSVMCVQVNHRLCLAPLRRLVYPPSAQPTILSFLHLASASLLM